MLINAKYFILVKLNIVICCFDDKKLYNKKGSQVYLNYYWRVKFIF